MGSDEEGYKRERNRKRAKKQAKGHGTAKLSAGLASGCPGAICLDPESPSPRGYWKASAHPAGGFVGGTPGYGLRIARKRADHPADSGQGRAPGSPAAWAKARWYCAAPASGCSPVGAVTGASPLHRSLQMAGDSESEGGGRGTVPCRLELTKPKGTSPGHRAGSLCRLWLSRRVPLRACDSWQLSIGQVRADGPKPDPTGRSGEDSQYYRGGGRNAACPSIAVPIADSAVCRVGSRLDR